MFTRSAQCPGCRSSTACCTTIWCAGTGGANGAAGGASSVSGGAGGSAGVGGAPCHNNSECASGSVCYVGTGICDQRFTDGHCIAKKTTACNGCACLEDATAFDACRANHGALCVENDGPSQCWSCNLPL
ncbi:MAG TPA: hypothetical protein VFK05_05655 [Polyangiaceae bacterium]|nr:hypothetical protein [Polyangiaceae bacterium]